MVRGVVTHRVLALALALSLAGAGCTIPSYHLPAGFSSTYHRQLYGMEPVAVPCAEAPFSAGEARRGIFYATTVFRDSSPSAGSDRSSATGMEPLFLGSDPLNPEKKIVRAPSNDVL